jgi:hypothetical protein
MARRMRRRTVAAGGRDCLLASGRPALATGPFAARQIAALFHLRFWPCTKSRCPELESCRPNDSRQFWSHITITNQLKRFSLRPPRSHDLLMRSAFWFLLQVCTSRVGLAATMTNGQSMDGGYCVPCTSDGSFTRLWECSFPTSQHTQKDGLRRIDFL